MKALVSAEVMLEAAVAAASNYADLLTDRDPDDGPHIAPGELRRFMARLRLLHGVPFSYLVPDAKLLPLESIRFFYIDRAWTDALVQGALSVGTVSSTDRVQLEAVYPNLCDEVDEAERLVRRPKNEAMLKAGSGTISGFLMRSRVISGWPNLHVRAYTRDVLPDNALTTAAESDPDRLKVLRLERLAPAVLLVLFDGVPSVVHIEEPRQGLQFGVRIDAEAPPAQRSAQLPVRDCNDGKLANVPAVNVPFRPNAPGVLNLAELRKRLGAVAPHSSTPMAPNQFALQMLRFPYRQVFGDPNDEQGERFFDTDRFQITLKVSDWHDRVLAHLNAVPR